MKKDCLFGDLYESPHKISKPKAMNHSFSHCPWQNGIHLDLDEAPGERNCDYLITATPRRSGEEEKRRGHWQSTTKNVNNK